MNKKVRITLELDNEFIKYLKTTCYFSNLGNLRDNYKSHTALQCLGIVALLEAMGATEQQIHAETPLEWRPHIQAIHEDRKVIWQ